MKGSERLKYVDAAKGFAVLLLVLYHAVNGYWQSNTYIENSRINFAISNVISTYTVSLFCLLSGIVYDKVYFAEGKLKTEKWIKQVINIFLLYIIYEMVYIIFKSFVSSQVVNPVTISDIKNIWKTSYGPYWYLYNLFFFYLIFAIPFLRKINPVFIILILASCALFKVYAIYALCFYLGILLSNNKEIWLFNIKTGIVCGILYVIIVVLSWKDEVLIIDTQYVNLLCAVFGSVFLISCFKKMETVTEYKFLGYFGKKSMEIFLWHQPIIMVCRVLLFRLNFMGEMVALIITMIIAVGIPVSFSNIFRNTFIYNLAFRPSKIVFDILGKDNRQDNQL